MRKSALLNTTFRVPSVQSHSVVKTGQGCPFPWSADSGVLPFVGLERIGMPSMDGWTRRRSALNEAARAEVMRSWSSGESK